MTTSSLVMLKSCIGLWWVRLQEAMLELKILRFLLMKLSRCLLC